MRKAEFFSKFDTRKGYYQIAIDKNDIKKTAFVTPFGKFAYKRIPLGPMNPPKYFHNVMVRILEGIENLPIFLDDIIVFTETLTEQQNIINEMPSKFHKKNTVINMEKSQACTYII